MDDEIKMLMEQCKEIYKCTRGAYFLINCNEKGWKLSIPSSGLLFKGEIKKVLSSYIKEITEEREEKPNPKNSKELKKYSY